MVDYELRFNDKITPALEDMTRALESLDAAVQAGKVDDDTKARLDAAKDALVALVNTEGAIEFARV